MNKKMKIERRDEGDTSFIEIGGIIDENSDFKEAFANLKKNVAIDLKGVDLINSCGVREWVHAVEKLPANAKVQYVNCAPRIVEQINYVANFLGRGAVQSFYVPYFCPKCKKETNVLWNVQDVGKARPIKVPAEKCPTCKGAMEFDDVEEEYFAFLDA